MLLEIVKVAERWPQFQPDRCHSLDKNEGISQPGRGNESEVLLRDLGISPLMRPIVSQKSPRLQKQ